MKKSKIIEKIKNLKWCKKWKIQIENEKIDEAKNENWKDKRMKKMM